MLWPGAKSSNNTARVPRDMPIDMHPIHESYRGICQHVISSGAESVFWNDTENSLTWSSVSFAQIFSDDVITTSRSSTFVTHHIHIVLLNTSPNRREWLITNGYTIVGTLPVSVHDFDVAEDGYDDVLSETNSDPYCPSVTLHDSVSLISVADGRDQNKLALQHALRRTVQELVSVHDLRFPITMANLTTGECFSTTVSYCADIMRRTSTQKVSRSVSWRVSYVLIGCKCEEGGASSSISAWSS